MPIQRDAEQIDALSEIFNIGVGKAAAAMGRLLRDEVLLSVPHVSVFTVSEAAQQLGTQGQPMYGVRQPFRGCVARADQAPNQTISFSSTKRPVPARVSSLLCKALRIGSLMGWLSIWSMLAC